MIKRKNVIAPLVMSALAIAFLTQTVEAQAWSFERKTYRKHPSHSRHSRRSRNCRYCRNYNRYPNSFGRVVFRLPNGSITIAIGGTKYHYHKGHYYRKGHHGYVDVSAPIGAYIKRLPYGYRRVRINRKTYYKYNGVYYRRTPGGYIVVENPTYHQKGFNRGRTKHVLRDIDEAQYFTVNIPNVQGGHTSVTLTRSGSGFIGPQGEYYDEFPGIAKLKVLYGS